MVGIQSFSIQYAISITLIMWWTNYLLNANLNATVPKTVQTARRSSISIVRRLFCLSERWHSSCHLEATFSPWVQTYILSGKLTVYSCTPKSLLRQTCTLTPHIRMAHIDKYSPPGIGTESAVFLRSSSFWTRTGRPHGACCGGHNQVRWGWREKCR